MDNNDILMQQFLTLRDEIKATKARIFWVVSLGLFGVPIITYFAESLDNPQFLPTMIPYVVIVLIVKFISEQNALMRAGQYIRRNIEPKTEGSLGWEAWLEGQGHLRVLDKHFFAVFILVFFVYYFMSIGYAVQVLWSDEALEPGHIWWTIAAIVTYGIGGIWALSTLLHHWKSVTGTSDTD
ncbi:MAG: hypothetical protein KAV82_03625 [Phycisphaerae bacterium]|nr:hypothetical protein [Phycisphaerae bacterium]